MLTTKNLQYLTLEQAIADLTYFAKNVALPFDTNGSSNADKSVSLTCNSLFLSCYLHYEIALGTLGRIIQWCSRGMDRVNISWNLLGISRFQCSSGSDLWLCTRILPLLKEYTDFRQWQYFVPVQQGMPANCSKDVSKVIDYIDNVLRYGNESKKQEFKDQFGLGALEHDDDFARSALSKYDFPLEHTDLSGNQCSSKWPLAVAVQ